MLMDFTDLKKIVNESIIDKFDHALILREDSPYAKEIAANYQNVALTNFQPTCENLIVYFASAIKERLPKSVSLFSLKLYETATSYVEWYASDNK